MKKPNTARGPNRWAQQARFDIEFAKRCVLEDGSCGTIMIVHTPDRAMLIPAPDLSKDATARYLRAVCIAEGAIAFSFVAEAWMRRMTSIPGETSEESLARATAVPPSQADDRIEVIIAETVYRDEAGERRTLHQSREIIRDAAGKPIECRPIAPLVGPGETVRSEGRWVEVLPEDEPTADQRASARAVLAEISRSFGVELQARPTAS